MTETSFSLPKTEREVVTLLLLDEVESTNDFVRNAKCSPYTLVLTDNQTRGRGRLDRRWITPRQKGIALSFVVPSDHASLSWYPLVAGWALVEEVRSFGLQATAMKWPNDVLVEDKKLAGILCESHSHNLVTVGLGINLGAPETGLPTASATSLFGESSVDWNAVDDLVAGWARRLKNWTLLTTEQKRESALRDVAGVLGTLGQEVRVQDMSGHGWTGRAQGLDESGHLLVMESETNQLKTVASADIIHLYQ